MFGDSRLQVEVTVAQRPPEYRRISHPSKEARRIRKRSGGMGLWVKV